MRDKKAVTIREYNGGTRNRGSSPSGWCELLQLPAALRLCWWGLVQEDLQCLIPWSRVFVWWVYCSFINNISLYVNERLFFFSIVCYLKNAYSHNWYGSNVLWLADRPQRVRSQSGSLKLIYWHKNIYLCLCLMVKIMNTYGKTGISSLQFRCIKCITFTGNSL